MSKIKHRKIGAMLSTVLILAFGFLGASASSLGVGCDGEVMPDGHVCESDGILHVSNYSN